MKAYKGSQFAIVKNEFIQDNLECDHALCERFHKNGCPPYKVVEWLIIDLRTNDRMGIGEAYDLRRDAVSALEYHLANYELEETNTNV